MKNTVVVSGSEGLIGKEICKYLEEYDYNILRSDKILSPFIDISCNLTVDSIFKMYNIVGLVNCAYPKDFYNHCTFFMKSTELFAFYFRMNKKYGSIINFSSIYGLIGTDESIYKDTEISSTPTWYSAAKGAIIAYSRHIATLYAKDDIRVNCIAAGGVYNNHSKKFIDNYSKKVPMNRMAYSKDMCGIVEFLISSRSSYITGQCFPVDGGLTIC